MEEGSADLGSLRRRCCGRRCRPFHAPRACSALCAPTRPDIKHSVQEVPDSACSVPCLSQECGCLSLISRCAGGAVRIRMQADQDDGVARGRTLSSMHTRVLAQ
eukprot:1278495-Rhodomonas_salina.1